MEEKKNVIAVAGPTATGKTSLGIFLAKAFDGEIVSCDSMQIYRGLPIGTAQPTAEERREAPHHLIDFLPLTESFSVSDYVKEAGVLIETLSARENCPFWWAAPGFTPARCFAAFLLRSTAVKAHCVKPF